MADVSYILHYLVSPGTEFNTLVVSGVFLVCFIGELSLPFPFLLGAVWLLAGYHFGAGLISLSHILILEGAAQLGRQAGAFSLFFLSHVSSVSVFGFLRKRFFGGDTGPSFPERFLGTHHIRILSPFSVTLGRLVGLRIPLTLILGIKKKPRILSLSVFLSSLVWDNAYIAVGMFGGHAAITPLGMVFYSLGGLAVLYAGVSLIKRYSRYFPRLLGREVL